MTYLNDLLLETALRLEDRRNIPNVLEHAFPAQVNFITHSARLKALWCTRRAAKSYSGGLYLTKEAIENENVNCLFIGLTRESAKNIIWKDILHVINDKYQLGGVPNKADLTMTYPSGSVISVTGIDADENEMKKLLGRKFRLVIVDEASMYTINLSNLIEGILGPAMVDPDAYGRSGTICLLGTSSDFARGLFYEITIGKTCGWELFKWSAHDNPYVSRQWKANLDKIAKERPDYMNTPQFRQWYLNEWVVDEEKLVYRFDMSRNLVSALPALPSAGWTFVLGVDTGWEDASAFVLSAYHFNDPKLYILRCFKKSKMTFDDVAAKCQEFMADPIYAPHKIIIDGANKQGVESMRFRSSIPFEYADKRDKVTFIELCNSDMISAKIKIIDVGCNRPLWEEMASLVWMTHGDQIRLPKKEHPSLQNHLCDAFLYAWRCGYHYSSSPAEIKTVVGSADWYRKQAEDIWERERVNIERENYGTDWGDEGSLGELG